MKNLFFLILLFAVMHSCKNSQEQLVTKTVVNGQEIPKIHFDNLPLEIEEIGISEFISDFKIVTLETSEECLIGSSARNVSFINDNLLIAAQYFPGPAPVFMFDMDGYFIREVGKGGKGPGEHTGYVVISIQTDNSILINFQDCIQLFNADGNYINDIKQPYDLMGDAHRYSDDVWFSTGSITGHPDYPRDSVMLVMHDAEGHIIKSFPRSIYPPKNNKGYTPSGRSNSVYKYMDQWKLYMPGLDTIFTLDNINLTPSVVLNLGEKRQHYNEVVDPASAIGKYIYSVVGENDNYWIFKNAEITKAEINEYKPGKWGGLFDSKNEFVIIDKKGTKARRVIFKDDIWGITDTRRLNDWSEIVDNNMLVCVLQAADIKELIEEKLINKDLNPDMKIRLTDLNSRITLESNPVVFIYYLKDKL